MGETSIFIDSKVEQKNIASTKWWMRHEVTYALLLRTQLARNTVGLARVSIRILDVMSLRITLTDPSNADVFGAWYSEDPVDFAQLAAGGVVTLYEDTTSSDSAEVLYDMTPPPSFPDRNRVWGRLDADGTLQLFLSPNAGDESYPFASPREFKDSHTLIWLLHAGGGLTMLAIC
jgi:hypothetical protein